MTLARAALVIALLFAGAPARAEQGSPQEREACKPDAIRYCADQLKHCPGILCAFTVGPCLIGAKAKLSNACRAVLAAHGF
jgi:hypothetical protein